MNGLLIMQDNYQLNKNYLWKYRELCQKIKHLEERIEDKERELMKIKGSNLSSVPKGSNLNCNRLDDLISEKLGLEQRLRQQLEQSWHMRDNISKSIDTIEKAISCKIVEMYYIDLKQLDDIADRLHISIRTAQRYYNQGLRQMRRVNA